jgi:hypothetical protein
MPPLVPLFPPSELTERVQVVQSGFIKEKRRKGPPVELEKCVLLEMVQYSCNPPSEGIQPPGVVKCKPLVRLFRRYESYFLFLFLFFFFPKKKIELVVSL